jgi:hypothetical protein
MQGAPFPNLVFLRHPAEIAETAFSALGTLEKPCYPKPDGDHGNRAAGSQSGDAAAHW